MERDDDGQRDGQDDAEAVACTPRLVVRPWRLDDADRLLDIQSRREVVQWLGDGEPVLMKDLDEARRRIRGYWERSLSSPLGVWAVVPRETGVPAGSVLLLELPNGAGEVEVGWHLHPDSHGRGYATEAARPVIERGFADGLPEIHALTHLDNHPSQAVCRRLGMADLGVVHRWYEEPSRHFRLTRQEHAAPPAG